MVTSWFKEKRYVGHLLVSTLLSGASVAATAVYSDPARASWLTFAFLYVSVWIFSTGICSLLGLAVRSRMGGAYLDTLTASVRQGALLGSLSVASLALSADGLLVWWVFGSLVLVAVAIEIFLNL